MEAGNMDRLIRIKENVGARDTKTGQQTTNWEDIQNSPEEWAQVTDDSGRELFQSDKKTTTSRKKFKIHFREDLNEMMAIEYQGRLYDIDRIQEIQRRRGLLIYGEWTQGKYNE